MFDDDSPLSAWKGTLRKKQVIAHRSGIRLRSSNHIIQEEQKSLTLLAEEAGPAMPPTSQ